MGRRSDFPRRKHDDYRTTDPRAVAALKPYLGGVQNFAEPCCGEGDLVDGLVGAGYSCVLAFDINEGVDALDVTNFMGADVIITNPPWTRQLLHPLILHFQEYLPTWLLLDSDWAFNAHAAPYLDRCTDIVAVGRLKWFNGTAGKDNVAWYRFWTAHRRGPRFHGRQS
jgi:hypothetical protein